MHLPLLLGSADLLKSAFLLCCFQLKFCCNTWTLDGFSSPQPLSFITEALKVTENELYVWVFLVHFRLGVFKQLFCPGKPGVACSPQSLCAAIGRLVTSGGELICTGLDHRAGPKAEALPRNSVSGEQQEVVSEVHGTS